MVILASRRGGPGLSLRAPVTAQLHRKRGCSHLCHFVHVNWLRSLVASRIGVSRAKPVAEAGQLVRAQEEETVIAT